MRRAAFSLLLLICVVGLSACGGGGSADPHDLVKETFGNAQKVKSGKIQVALNLNTQGIAAITEPIKISFGGPFERPAKGAPHYAFTLTGSAQGQSVSAGAVSTGTQGFVSVQHNNYVLPAAQYAKLNQSYQQVTGVAQPKTNASGDIPWLSDLKTEGDETIAGAETTHVSGKIDVGKLLDGLEKNPKSAAQKLTPTQRQQIIGAVKNPTFDFWTGKDDKILRRVVIAFRIEVPPASQAQFRGLKSVDVKLDNTLTDLNEPQTISALPNPQPLSQLTSQIRTLLAQIQQLQGSSGLGLGSGSGSGSGGGSSGSSGTSGAQADKYRQCLTQAGSDIAAAQKCAALLK